MKYPTEAQRTLVTEDDWAARVLSDLVVDTPLCVRIYDAYFAGSQDLVDVTPTDTKVKWAPWLVAGQGVVSAGGTDWNDWPALRRSNPWGVIRGVLIGLSRGGQTE